MKELTLTALIDEPKILGDYEHTWTVENWRSLSKREHGPVFQAGGYPWCVLELLMARHCRLANVLIIQANPPLPPWK